jgi:hypothetical protein
VRKERVIPIWEASTSGAVAYYRDGDESHNPFGPPSPAIMELLGKVQQYTPPALA